MALKEVQLTDLVDRLDTENNEFADFFRPMLGYDSAVQLNESINDDAEPILVEIEDEIGYEFPPDLVSLYLCSNGGRYGDMELFPVTNDKDVEETINKLNVFDKSLKQSLALNNATLLVGRYNESTYVICYLKEDGVYSYALYDGNKKEIKMEFENIVQLVALEVSYVIDYDGLAEYANESNAEE